LNRLVALVAERSGPDRKGHRTYPLLSATARQEQLADPHLPALIVHAHNGSTDLLRITQLGVVQISDDNAARAVDHSRDRALSISTGSSVTRLVNSGYS
jgi:hypothetical protein